MTFGELGQRAACVLLDEPDETTGAVRLPQAAIAGLLGSLRSGVNRALNELAAAGHVEPGYRHIEVVDPVGLRGVFG